MALDTSKCANRNGVISNKDVPSVTRDNSKISLAPQTEEETPTTALDIYTELNKYVVGQHEAKKALCVAAANHLKRIAMKDPTVKKSNVMLVGPTGCGKTHLVSSLAKILDVPFASVSANSMTAAGYVGGNVEDCLRSLIFNASNMKKANTERKSSLQTQAAYHITKAEHGIVMIDEVDKIRKKGGSGGRDIGGESVQQGLLTMIEGTVMNVNINGSGSTDQSNIVSIDTSNILFVFSGAFPDIQDIVKNRLTSEGVSAFEMDEDEIYANVKETDLESFGMIPEFIGRIPILSHIRSLSKEEFEKILIEPKDAIFSQFRKLFSADGATLNVTKELIGYIAQKAKEKKRGARGLRTVLEDLLADAQFISNSYAGNHLSFYMTLFDDGAPGTIVKAPKDIAEEIRAVIASGDYGNFSIEIADI